MGWVCIQTPATGSGIKPGRLWGLRFTAKGTEAQPLGTVAAEQVAGVMEAPGLDLTENQVQTGPGSGWELRGPSLQHKQPCVSAGASRKSTSPWQPGWGRQRRKSKCYIQV